jgi:hypothetical protein
VKSITHSVVKLLKLDNLDIIVSKELNLVLDFCGRIMNDMNNTCTISTDDGPPISECNSITSKLVENYASKGLQQYKELSSNPSISNVPDCARLTQVRTSHSNSRNTSKIISPAEEQEFRVRQINRDLLMNSKEVGSLLQASSEKEWSKERRYVRINMIFSIRELYRNWRKVMRFFNKR